MRFGERVIALGPYLQGAEGSDSDAPSPGLQGAADPGRTATLSFSGADDPQGCLQIVDLGGAGELTLCDTPAARLTEGLSSWAPDGRGLVVPVALRGRFDRPHLAWIPLHHRTGPELQLLLQPTARETGARVLSGWIDAQRFVLSERGGDHSAPPDRIGVYDLHRGEVDWVRTLEHPLADLRMLRPGGQAGPPILLALLHRPEGDLLQTMGLGGEVLHALPLDGAAQISEDDGEGQALIQVSSTRRPPDSVRIEIDADGQVSLANPQAHPSVGLTEPISQCEVERIERPAKGSDPTAETTPPRADWLFIPKAPLDRPAAQILPLHEPVHRFSPEIHLSCEAGIATWVPDPPLRRGSIVEIGDPDRLDDAVTDLLDARRALIARGYPAERIGLVGRGHSGQAVLRLLASPAEDPALPFAFGIAEATPTRPPRAAPLAAPHLLQLQAPLLLIHDAGDDGSDEHHPLATDCAEAESGCTYLEIAGQRRPIRDKDPLRRLWKAHLRFVEEALGEGGR